MAEDLVLLRSAVASLTGRGRYREAVAAAERLLGVTERDFGAESPEVAEVVGRIGLLCTYLGKNDVAEHRYHQAFAVLEKLPPERGRPELRIVLTNLGALYCRSDRFVEAEPILK